MTSKPKQKLELTWIGKEKRPRLEPRILLEDKELSYRSNAAEKLADDLFADENDAPKAFDDNILIHGDNLLALKALEQKYAETVKCIYVDPPFNTGEAFENYEDGLEHSLWLTLIYQRIQILYALLKDDGHFFVHIDDNELAYLMIICDEIFGRQNRCAVITFKQSSVSGPKAQNPGLVTTSNYLIWYSKNKKKWKPNRVFKPVKRDSRYSKYIDNIDAPYKEWNLVSLKAAFAQSLGLQVKDLKKKFGDKLEEELEGFVLRDPRRVVRTARVKDKDVNEVARSALQNSRENAGVFRAEREDKDDYYFIGGEQLLFYSNKTQLIDGKFITGEALSNIWDDLLSNNLHKEGGVRFPKGKKPEQLIKRVLDLTTEPGDWVLDSFAGSGTTAAVAHKMGRKWITIELGEQAVTHIVPRLKRTINGSDQDGVSKSVNWQGGGGYRYFRLAPSLLKKDNWGNWIINKEYNAEMLSEAMCKHMGFTYAPSQKHFWMHGYSTETDFIYVTTGSLSQDQLKVISDEVGKDRSLVICCKAFMADAEQFPNLTLKKIPQAILHKCEWDHDDYSFSLNVLPDEEEEQDEVDLGEDESEEAPESEKQSTELSEE
ncbi:MULTISPECIES: site-specific DNA-methyltransferase [unclassified Ketobacter]|uniref:site-specific DNA-methyltransferase n=1 Tax=unclassified Ketobacter TaxID=2639109 RepID=UPI000F1141EB|nr:MULTISPECIES: site-specific DNA-methyltransferase [unclassified Ketobacter]RLT87703.1 MAG: site-specific DNA-methyltransferase [Ketobacter sp. GenoA1]RLT96632.1 MAG: site-specific DNA-methyltransferase [Ketobacter sp.]